MQVIDQLCQYLGHTTDQKQAKNKNLCISVEDDVTTQPAFTCSELTIERLYQGVKYVQS